MDFGDHAAHSDKRADQPAKGMVLTREQLRRNLSQGSTSTNCAPDKKDSIYDVPRKGGDYTLPPKRSTNADTVMGPKGDIYHLPQKAKSNTLPARPTSSKPVLFSVVPDEKANNSEIASARDSSGFPSEDNDVQLRNGPSRDKLQQLRVTSQSEEGPVDAVVSMYEDDDGSVKGVMEVSAVRQTTVATPQIKVRVICLIDVSGSMLLKGDKHNSRSKISIMKKMAAELIVALEDHQDFFGVMTFGKDSRVICPLTLVSAATRTQMQTKISELDKDGGFSAVTDLSSALLQAIEMLTSAQEEESLLYRNCVIVFSDGEVNAGLTDPAALVHATREKVRELALPRDIVTDQWVNISCVTTGSNFSQSLYLLSKMCGSDAYFYVDGSKNHPEVDMLIPLMLRKTACAQMVSVSLRGINGAVLNASKSSREHGVRRRRGREELEGGSLAYFIHDLQRGSKKTFQFSIDVEGLSSDGDYNDDDDHGANTFLALELQYVDTLGALHVVNRKFRRDHVGSLRSNIRSSAGEGKSVEEAIAKTAFSTMRQLFQDCGRNVANTIEDIGNVTGNDDENDIFNKSVNDTIQSGKDEVKAALTSALEKVKDADLRSQLENFSNAAQANLAKLSSLLSLHANRRGHGWQNAKAMTSAVARETPTVTQVLLHAKVLTPRAMPQQASSGFSTRLMALSHYVTAAEAEEEGGEGGEGGGLHGAARDVASSLASVLAAMEITASEASAC